MIRSDVAERIRQAQTTGLLDLSDLHNLDEIPAEVFSLAQLRVLNLKGNPLEQLPSDIHQLRNLRVLNLAGHRIKHLPDEFFNLELLEELDLTGHPAASGLQALPNKLSRLSCLRELNLSNNSLCGLPPTIGHLSHIEELSLTGNCLSELPEEIEGLINLSELFLSDNQLQSLPSSLGALKNLKGLYLQRNRLEQLPPSIGQLHQLETLNLSYNLLREIPLSLRQLRRLQLFDLRHNPLTEAYSPKIYHQFDLPSVIVGDLEHKHSAIQRDLEISYEAKHEEPLAEAKLILLGDGTAGKTSLVNRLVYDSFNQDEGTTRGVNITSWSLNEVDPPLRLNVWDFAGQAIMHATHQLFLTECSIYLIVLNARQEVQEERLIYWLNVIMSFAGEQARIIVVINRCDEGRLFLNQRGLREKYGIRDFIETSAKTGEGIEALRNKIIEIARQELTPVQRIVKLSWKTVRRHVEERMSSQTLERVSLDDFRQICVDRRVEEQKDQAELLDLLHEIGVVFSPKTTAGVRYLLDPEQITKSIYELQSSQQTQKAQRDDGRVSPAELSLILADIDMARDRWEMLKPLMQQYDLCLELSNGDLVFTRLLPIEEPALALPANANQPTTRFTYRYNFLPESVLPRFIGALPDKLCEQTVDFEALWSRGVKLRVGGLQLALKIEPESRRTDLAISGGEPGDRRHLLEQIRRVLGCVHDQIAYLSVEQLVPLPLDGSGNELLVPYDHLLRLQMEGQHSFIPYGGRDVAEVQELLGQVEREPLERRKLREYIDKAFNWNELKFLCFDLNIDHENLDDHRTKGGLSREVILYMERRGRINELIAFCKQERPEIDWSSL